MNVISKYLFQLYFTRQFHCNIIMLKLRFFTLNVSHKNQWLQSWTIQLCAQGRLLTISTNTFRNTFTWTVQMHILVTEWWRVAPTVILLPNFAFLGNFQWILLVAWFNYIILLSWTCPTSDHVVLDSWPAVFKKINNNNYSSNRLGVIELDITIMIIFWRRSILFSVAWLATASLPRK